MCIEASHDHLVLHFINTLTFVASIFGSGEARRGSIPRSGAVTEEQRCQNRKATQPSGRRFFLARTSLLALYRPLPGLRVARASSGPKIPRRKRDRIYEMEYLGERARFGRVQSMPCRLAFSGIVARASRPCESCHRHAGETPLPLPSENQTACFFSTDQ